MLVFLCKNNSMLSCLNIACQLTIFSVFQWISVWAKKGHLQILLYVHTFVIIASCAYSSTEHLFSFVYRLNAGWLSSWEKNSYAYSAYTYVFCSFRSPRPFPLPKNSPTPFFFTCSPSTPSLFTPELLTIVCSPYKANPVIFHIVQNGFMSTRVMVGRSSDAPRGCLTMAWHTAPPPHPTLYKSHTWG